VEIREQERSSTRGNMPSSQTSQRRKELGGVGECILRKQKTIGKKKKNLNKTFRMVSPRGATQKR